MERIWQNFYDKQVPKEIRSADITIYDLFLEAVKENPGGLATLFFGAGIRYGVLSKLVDRFAACLTSVGVKAGDRVALVLPNLPIYPIAHFAVMKLGGILVPTNPLYVERELAYQLTNSASETVVILDKLYPRLLKVQDKTPVKRVVVSELQDFLPGAMGFLYGLKNKLRVRTDPSRQVYRYQDLMKTSIHAAGYNRLNPEEPAMLLYTGGTTGVSKGAVLTHRNLVANVMQTEAWLWSMEKKKESLLCVLPFFHSYGMTTGLHLAIAIQSTMILVPRFDISEVIRRIRKNKPTIFCGVPSMYNAIMHSPKVSRGDIGSIKLCVSGGSGLPEIVQKQFEKLTGGRLVEGYGLSETSPVTHINPIHGHRKSGSIGVPVPGTDARIVDPETHQDLPAGHIGELAVRGPQVMQGYWNMPEETRRVLQDGWMFTGDMAVMDEEGFFKIIERKKDVVISAGMNIYPREVEEVLMQHPKISEVAVVGMPCPVRGEKVKAFVVPRKGEILSRADVVRFCKDKLSRYKIPRDIEFREMLPKSVVGKILKRVLKEDALRRMKYDA